MRRNGIRRAAVALTLAVTALGGTPAIASAAASSGCVVYDNLTEKVLESHYDDQAPAGYSVGDSGTFHNQLIKDGVVIADVTGTSHAVYQSGDHLYTIMENKDVYKDGVVQALGINDTSALIAGEKLSIPAVGLSGKLKGKIGTRSYQRTATDGVYTSSLKLC
jgi:hypothetical protein